MLKIENVVLPSADQWKAIIFGARNPLNSWARSDSKFNLQTTWETEQDFKIGPNDLDLMTRLRNAGTDHRKFMRMITVYVDITAPLYWFKEFDTYKVGTVANSCSTMHKIAAKKFTLEDFSCEHSDDDYEAAEVSGGDHFYPLSSLDILKITIEGLNTAREKYLEAKENCADGFTLKKYWWQMIQLLPSSYNQRRTVLLNYEVLANMYKSRKNHKLDEWKDFSKWIETLPYSELITGGKENGESK